MGITGSGNSMFSNRRQGITFANANKINDIWIEIQKQLHLAVLPHNVAVSSKDPYL